MLDTISVEWEQIATICTVVSMIVSAVVMISTRTLRLFVENSLLLQSKEIAEGRTRMINELRDRFIDHETLQNKLDLIDEKIALIQKEIEFEKERLAKCKADHLGGNK